MQPGRSKTHFRQLDAEPRPAGYPLSFSGNLKFLFNIHDFVLWISHRFLLIIHRCAKYYRMQNQQWHFTDDNDVTTEFKLACWTKKQKRSFGHVVFSARKNSMLDFINHQFINSEIHKLKHFKLPAFPSIICSVNKLMKTKHFELAENFASSHKALNRFSFI